MAILLGIDTGGTYTDAVLYDEDRAEDRVIASAKALTTKHDLAIGIGGAVAAVLSDAGIEGPAVSLTSISTTLATNALVEGQGRRVGLVFIGFDEADLGRAGLDEALGGDPVLVTPGGYKATGEERAPLKLDLVQSFVDDVVEVVDAFAVVAIFGGRNPAHEIAVRDMIRARTSLPVTCGHELSNALHGPRNALTCVLNARLIGMISDLIAATEAVLFGQGIAAPLMLVRGDGSLVSADFAKLRPIETILSGPAASLIGAAELTGQTDALISDIGGTTTDIAVLRGGRPALSPEGARVGGHRTMVDAVEMFTHGLGGDSQVRIDEQAFQGGLILGPRRVIPVSLLAVDHAELVHEALDRQIRATILGELDGRFLIPVGTVSGLPKAEAELLEDLGDTPAPADQIVNGRVRLNAMERLVARGLVRLSGLTPSDASHVLGLHEAWDTEAAQKAATLFARKRNRKGGLIAADGAALSQVVIDTLTRRSAEVLLEAALTKDGLPAETSPLIGAALRGHSGNARIDIGVDLPVIGLGASAATYYPAIAKMLGAPSIVPKYAEVANAVGAVAGRIRIERTLIITSPNPDAYRVHTADDPPDFRELEAAKKFALDTLRAGVIAEAEAAGAAEIETRVEYSEKAPDIGGQTLFVEGVVTAQATGRPRF
jgi:N-methylhydantoinase A/oxoprolinase/acetone carboxylase beta subunit